MICRVSPLPPTFKVRDDDHIGNEDDDNDNDCGDGDGDDDVGGDDDDDNDNDRGDEDNDDDDNDITSSPSFLHSRVKEDASAG